MTNPTPQTPEPPAAQAVRDHFLADAAISFDHGLAAALRAAGEQLEAAPSQSHQIPGINAAERQLRRLAAELETARQGEQS